MPLRFHQRGLTPSFMFTGLVEMVGKVRETRGDSPRRLVVESSLPTHSIALGASIAIDGCCLTVVEKAEGILHFEAATETLARTTLGDLVEGDTVNLEQSLTPSARLGGHLVMGHVDGIGCVRRSEERGSALYVSVELPTGLERYVAARGSITINGVSLTVTDVEGRVFTVALIPHTLQETSPRAWVLGARVNIEVDVIARYLERLLEARGQS